MQRPGLHRFKENHFRQGHQARNPPRQSSKSLCHLHHQARHSRRHKIGHSFSEECSRAWDQPRRSSSRHHNPAPPGLLKKRLRPAGHFENGVSLLRSPPEKKAWDYHLLFIGTAHGAEGGETSRFIFEDKHFKLSARDTNTSLVNSKMHRKQCGIPNSKIKTEKLVSLVCE